MNNCDKDMLLEMTPFFLVHTRDTPVLPSLMLDDRVGTLCSMTCNFRIAVGEYLQYVIGAIYEPIYLPPCSNLEILALIMLRVLS